MTSPAKLIACFGGGAARGAVQVHTARQLRPTEVHGTSVGALTAAACASGQLDDLERLWRGLRSWWSLMRLSCTPWRGLLTLAPVRRHILATLHPARLQVPTYAHVVDWSTEQPEAIALHDLTTAEQLADALIASCSQTGLHAATRWRGRWVGDGGARYTVPVPLDVSALRGDEVVAVACSAVGRPWRDEPVDPDTLSAPQVLGRALGVLFGHPARASGRRLRALADSGVRVTLVEPATYPGAPWDASRETIRWRLDDLGPASWAARRTL